MASELLATVSIRTGQGSGAAGVAASATVSSAYRPSGEVRQAAAPVTGNELPAETASAPQNSAQAAKELADHVNRLNEFAQSMKRELEFSVDEDSQRTVVKVRDSKTGDVIRQIPSEEVLRLSERLSDVEGLFVREQA